MLKALHQKWLETESEIKAEIAQLPTKDPEKIENELNAIFGDRYPNYWWDVIVKPVANEIKEHGKFARVVVLGPFGLGARVSIHCYPNEESTVDQCMSITFEPDLCKDSESPLKRVNYNENIERFAPGTIGAINGLNHPSEPVPVSTSGSAWLALLN